MPTRSGRGGRHDRLPCRAAVAARARCPAAKPQNDERCQGSYLPIEADARGTGMPRARAHVDEVANVIGGQDDRILDHLPRRQDEVLPELLEEPLLLGCLHVQQPVRLPHVRHVRRAGNGDDQRAVVGEHATKLGFVSGGEDAEERVHRARADVEPATDVRDGEAHLGVPSRGEPHRVPGYVEADVPGRRGRTGRRRRGDAADVVPLAAARLEHARRRRAWPTRRQRLSHLRPERLAERREVTRVQEAAAGMQHVARIAADAALRVGRREEIDVALLCDVE